jgi:hypothetical protein
MSIDIPNPTKFPDDHALTVMSKRFQFNWAGVLFNRDTLAIKAKSLLLEDSSSASEAALVALIRGCSRSDSRLEEYSGGPVQEDVWQFFASKASWYQTLHQKQLLLPGSNSRDIEAAVASCRANRAQALTSGLLYREFNGFNAAIKERFLPLEAIQSQNPDNSGIQLRWEPHGLQIPTEMLTSVCSRLRQSARLFASDAIIITYPQYIDSRIGEASDFSCHFDDSAVPIPDSAKSYIRECLIGNKVQEQSEITQLDYVKRYMNLSTYFGAEYKPHHHPIGFRGAMRWVIDFKFRGEWILGMLDIRVVRFGVSRFSQSQLGEFAGICLNFQSEISRVIGHYTPNTDLPRYQKPL